jgi:hypothetical protein
MCIVELSFKWKCVCNIFQIEIHMQANDKKILKSFVKLVW